MQLEDFIRHRGFGLDRQGRQGCVSALRFELCQIAGTHLSALASELEDRVSGPRPGGWSQVETRVLDALSARSPRAVEDVAQRSGLTIAQTQAVLGALELEGAAALRECGWVRTGGAR